MRRAPMAVAAAAAGLAGVLTFNLNGSRASLPARLKVSPRTTTAPGAPATTQPSGPMRVAVGASEQYGYGVLSVKATVKGQRITDVSVVKLQTAEPYSQSIAQQVIPMLRNEVLAAQSARINGISGATYTSQAYAYSLQSALDRLHVK